VGRISWNTLMVRDRRHVTNLNQVFAECLEHQRLATADGSLESVMTVFAPRQPGTRMGTRFWIPQLVRFASYEQDDGTLIGDRANKAYTDECLELGWKPPVPRTEFDVLPIVIEDTVSGLVQMFVLPKEYHKVTMIEHPKYPDFAKLGLRWCVVPTVTCMTLKLGGLEYGCCPFNGWFMETEITRDLLEAGRMDKMGQIAKAIGIEEDEDDFWRERVAIETNKAVMHSFRRDKHTVVDHVTAQYQFLGHDAREKREGRECPAQWSWVVPAIGGSTLPIWHHEMRDFYIEPQYEYQAELFAVRKESNLAEDEVFDVAAAVEQGFESILILYASVTGTAEAFSYRAKKALRPLKVIVESMGDVNPKTIASQCVSGGGMYSAVLFITSTFGEGLPPPNGEKFFEVLRSMPTSALSDVPYAVMAIGSSIYPDFCQAGIDLNQMLGELGGKEILPLTKGDEVNQREETVLQWITSVGSLFDVQQKLAIVLTGDSADWIEENDPITAELLPVDSDIVQAALAEENGLKESICSGDSSSMHSSSAAVARLLPAGYKLCEVTMNDELVSFPTEESKALYRSTRFLEFNLEGGVSQCEEKHDLVYETGDHARILPVNDSSVVLAMCQCLELNPEQWVHIKVEDGPAFPASTIRVGDLMAMEIDLATSQDDGNLPLLKCLINAAQASGDKSDQSSNELSRLEDISEFLLSSANLAHYPSDGDKGNNKEQGNNTSKALMREEARTNAIKTLTEEYVTIPDLLQQFPVATSNVSLAELLDVLPRLKPRHYSIASSSEMNPTKLQLSVGKLTITHKSTGKSRLGVCSHFLAGRTTAAEANGNYDLTNEVFCTNATQHVRLGITRSTFRLPKDSGLAPIIMVGPGTGVAPMLGFLQSREKALSDGVELGPCMVFFGCRSENDFLHSERMRAWVETGVITDLQVAFSRLLGQPKQYVQHLVKKHCTEVWAMLSDPRCHYYVCGDSNMAEDVFDELKATARNSGGLDHIGSIDFFRKMKKEHRFQADTWGVVEKRDIALKKLVEKKYNQAEAWLKNFDKEEEKKEAT